MPLAQCILARFLHTIGRPNVLLRIALRALDRPKRFGKNVARWKRERNLMECQECILSLPDDSMSLGQMLNGSADERRSNVVADAGEDELHMFRISNISRS